MNPRRDPSTSSTPAFDQAWLDRCVKQELFESEGISVLRLHDAQTSSFWIARSASIADARACELLQREARLATGLSCAWAMVPSAGVWTPNRMMWVAPATESTLTANLLPTPVSIAAYLDLAVSAAQSLSHMHHMGLVHGDVRTANLIVDEGHRARLTGFGFATEAAPKTTSAGTSLRTGAPSLPYQSAELGRAASVRASPQSDLYALGVALYEILTAELPLTGHSVAAWQHAHAAIEPRSPRLLRDDAPEPIASILLKLLAKEPRARYTSAESLLSDLSRCRQAWRDGEDDAFALDASGALPAQAMATRLVGRERETQALADAFARVTASSEPELVLLSGAAGGGKSMLAHWLIERARAQGARAAEGKSDQLKQSIPFAPVAQLLRTLTAELLGESDATLASVRQRWLEALSGQGQALVELVPEIEHVLGRSAPLAEVSASQGRARVEIAVLKTLAALATPGSPLVVFVDDVQWADDFTVGWLQSFVAQAPRSVLLIAAYRSAQPEAASRVLESRHASRSQTVAVTELAVDPFGLAALVDLVAATLGEASTRVRPLAHAILNKTAGNPYFSNQLLQTWIDEGVLYRDAPGSAWQWDEAEIAHSRYTDRVVDLMIRRFSRFPRSSTALLPQLASVGLRCDDALLARLAGQTTSQISNSLRPFVDAGLLVREAAGHAFQHDRVLEFAYSQVEPEQRGAAHGRVASAMIELWKESLPEHAFEICNQIARAGDASSVEESASFVEVLLEAGRRAKSAAAIAQARTYMETALGHMGPDWWTTHFELAYGVRLLRCECLLAQADLEAAALEIESLLAHPMPPLERAAIHRLEAILHTVRSDYEGAIQAALSGLDLLGVHLQRHPSRADLEAARGAVESALGTRPIAALGTLPATGNRRVQGAMSLLATLISSMFVDDGISFLHLAKMVELTLEHGATIESPYGLSWFGVFIASLYQEWQAGLDHALAAMALIDRNGYEPARIATLVALDQVAVWTRPLEDSLAYAQRAASIGLASGDIAMACYACNHIVSDLLVMGESLALVADAVERGLEQTRAINYLDIELILASQQRFMLLLQHGSVGPAAGRAALSEEERVAQSNSLPTRFWIWLYGGMAAVYLGQWARAIELLTRAETLAWSAPAHINVADCHLYRAIAHAQAVHDGSTRGHALSLLQEQRDRFGAWAALNPGTFQSKLMLIEAQLAALSGDPLTGMTLYERSANAAAAAGFTHEHALAHELAAKLCREHSLLTSASQHARVAGAGYRRWGADHKAMTLIDRDVDRSRALEAYAPSSQEAARQVVWGLDIQAAQALSGEGVMERLIETLMTNILVHAGANYGLLLLMRDEGPTIEASGRVVGEKITVTQLRAEPSEQMLPMAVLNSVVRTQQVLVLADASADAASIRHPRRETTRLRSIICLPLLRGGALVGAIYLENNLAPGIFDERRVAQLETTAPQVAVALETARLYEQLIDETGRRADAELSLRTARAELVEKSHLTLLANLAASIGHEVNQPLASIVTSADASLRWLKRPAPELLEVEAGLQSIRQDGQRAAKIIRALRSLAKQAPSVTRPVRIDTVVGEVLSMMRADIDGRGVRLSVSLSADVSIDADRVQLQQVILNLLNNALDAMANSEPMRKELRVVSGVQDRQVLVRVLDRGPGIDPSKLDRIFDPFFTTKSEGLGMGLAICRTIVEAHGGALHALQRQGGGSEFVLSLPERNHAP